MESLVSGVNHNVSETCVCKLHITARDQGTRYSNDTASLLPQPTLLAEATITCRLVLPLLNTAFRQAVSTFTNLVLCHLWLCRIILKPTLHFFLYSSHLNWYMQHQSLASEKPLLSGEILCNKSLFNF